MVVIQVLLLSTQRRQRARLGVCLPGAVALFGFSWSSPLAHVVLPDGKPRFEESARYAKFTPDRTRQQFGELLLFFGGQVLGLMQEERTVDPQVFSHATDLVPVAPGERWRLNHREDVGCAAQFGHRGRIGWRQLEPLAHRAVVDPEVPSNGPSGRDVLVQRMGLGDAQRAAGQAPAVPLGL